MSLFRRNIMMAAPKYLTAWRLVGNSSVHTDENLKSWSVAGNSQIHLGNLTQWKVSGNSQIQQYLTQWKVEGNSVVDNNAILSCGDLGQDGKYHVKISNGVDVFDIALTEPLRKVNDIADSIEFVNGVATLTRLLKGVFIKDCNVTISSTNNPDLWRYIVSTGAKNLTTNVINTKYAYNTRTYYCEEGINVSSGGAVVIFDSAYASTMDAQAFKAANADVELIYELATPTTETIQAPQISVSSTNTYSSDNTTPYSAFTYANPLIYSCGDYSDVDGKYHVKISNGVTIYDIPLTEPLRKVNDVADSIEFVNGVTTVTRYFASDDMGNYSYTTQGPTSLNNYRLRTNSVSTFIKRPSSSGVVGNALCAIYPTNKATEVYSTRTEGIAVDNTGVIYIFDEDFSYPDSAAAFKAAMAGVELIYELATPTTEVIQVSPFPISPTDTYTSANVVSYSAFEHTENKEIWSCGDYSDVDGKYHVKISNGVEVFDIPLTQPLRKVNGVADKIEFANGTAVVTRNIASTKWNDCNVTYQSEREYKRFLISSVSSLIIKPTDFFERVQICLSSDFIQNNAPLQSSVETNSTDLCMAVYSDGAIYIRDTSTTSTEDFYEKYGTHELLYRLATPTTEVIQVSPFPISATDTYTSQTETAYSSFTFEKNMEIWSCGELSTSDNKYHIYIQSNGRTFDIALTEPLRKVGNVADKIEFTDGVATVTRNLAYFNNLGSLSWGTSEVIGQSNVYSLFCNNTLNPAPKIVGYDAATILCALYPAKSTYNIARGTVGIGMAASNIRVYDPTYNQVDSYVAFNQRMQGVGLIYWIEPITETITVSQIQVSKTNTYTQIISSGAKAIGWTEFETNLETLFSYGVQWDITQTSPDVTRIGNMEYHALLPIQSQMRGCLLDDNGTVTKYLTQEDWNLSTLGDETHQVMIELPEFWWKFVKNGNTRKVLMSAVSLSGYTRVPKMYVSAYEATIDRGNAEGTGATSTWKLASVKNNSPRFRGGNNDSSKDSAYNTLLQMPATNISLTEYRTYARRRKANSSEWNLYTFQIHKILYWLFVVEYATRNSQKAINNTLTTEGYHQGGLGNGPTNANDSNWNRLFSYYPFIPIGTSDSLGNNTGQVAYASLNDSSTIWCNTQSNRYRGIENPFGHIWKWVDGIHVQVESGENGESKVYVTDNPSLWQDSNNNNYNYVGNETRVNSYVKDILFDDGNIMCSDSQTSSTQYYCDYHYVNIPSSGSSLRAVRGGGSAYIGSSAGFVCSATYNAPSGRYAYIGSRLCFVPENF